MKNLALIGCGYWGKNYIKSIENISDLNLKYIQDINKPASIPGYIRFTEDLNEILKDEEIQGVIIATPPDTHYDIALKAIQAKKNVLVEKPITTSSGDAEKLCEAARKNDVVLMVGHIFKYNSATRDVKKRLEEGEIGDIRYIESRRIALGPIRQSTSTLWDLAVHDIYIAKYLIGERPLSVSCVGESHNKSIDDIVSLNLRFPNDILTTIYANWEHPIKERKIIIGGTKKAILFDDVEPTDKIIIYDRGVDYNPKTGDFGEFQAITRTGDTIIPKIKLNQPLEEELKHFSRCIDGEKCLTDGDEGLETIKILEAAEKSRKNGGVEVKIE